MIAIDVLWTERFHRLRAVRKSPPDRTLKAIQTTTSDHHAQQPGVEMTRLQWHIAISPSTSAHAG
jgi:hypothetical protein